MTESKLALIVAIIAVIGVVFIAGLKVGAPITIANSQSDRNIITVTGTQDLQVAPDKAEITFQIITNASTATEASAQNKNLVGSVMNAIRAEGVANDDIETTNVYLNKLTEWDYKTNQQVDKGYQQITTIRVTVRNLEQTGAVLDAGISGGANSVNDVSFGLTKEMEAKYKKEAIDDAAAVAKEKAKLLADAAGATLGRVTSLSENSYSYVPWRYGGVLAKADSATPINPEKVSLSVSVNIGYELQ